MIIKHCNRCNLEKKELDFTSSNFLKKGGWCRNCNKEYKKNYYQNNKEIIAKHNNEYYTENKLKVLAGNKKYNDLNKEAIKEQKRNYRENNKNTIKESQKKYRENNNEKVAIGKRKYYDKNKEEIKNKEQKRYQENKDYIKNRIRNWERDKVKSDPIFKLRKGISRSIRLAIKSPNGKNGKSILYFLPYTILELRSYIENLFEPWMSWENWGVYIKETWDDNDQSTWTWHIDHIIPQVSLPFSSMGDENFLKCWALSNLRPISSKVNMHDSAKGFKKQRRGSK